MVNLLGTAKQTINKIVELAKTVEWKIKSKWYNKVNAISRAIALSQDEFSLIIAIYKSKKQENRWIEKLSKKSKIITVRLKPSTEKLMPEIIEAIKNVNPKPSSAVFVTGIDAIDVEAVFDHANKDRESFRELKTPLVLWCDRATFARITRVAPDLNSWASNPLGETR